MLNEDIILLLFPDISTSLFYYPIAASVPYFSAVKVMCLTFYSISIWSIFMFKKLKINLQYLHYLDIKYYCTDLKYILFIFLVQLFAFLEALFHVCPFSVCFYLLLRMIYVA